MTHARMPMILAMVTVLQWAGAPARGQGPAEPDAAPAPVLVEPAAPVAAPNPAPPPADEVMNQLLDARQAAPVISPTEQPRRSSNAPPVIADIDPAVLGVAPGSPPPQLRREGSFIISRKGRLQRSGDGAHRLFVFEADGQQTPELPMILLPSQMLQNMEDLVQQRGDRVLFILSGQITTYRGANYLLPTMMRLAIDDGNL